MLSWPSQSAKVVDTDEMCRITDLVFSIDTCGLWPVRNLLSVDDTVMKNTDIVSISVGYRAPLPPPPRVLCGEENEQYLSMVMTWRIIRWQILAFHGNRFCASAIKQVETKVFSAARQRRCGQAADIAAVKAEKQGKLRYSYSNVIKGRTRI